MKNRTWIREREMLGKWRHVPIVILLAGTLVMAMSACSVKLIDIDTSVPRLNLSEEQLEVVQPKMMAIKEIADEYNAEKEQFEEEPSKMIGGGMDRGGGGGDRSQLRGRFEELRKRREEFLKKRESYLSAIRVHVADIKAVLNQEQLITFEKMELPKLETPETPGGRRSGMGGRGGGGRRGGKGGGGRRGGGMF